MKPITKGYVKTFYNPIESPCYDDIKKRLQPFQKQFYEIMAVKKEDAQ